MKISTKERYAMRSMLDLAENYEKGYIPLNVIAKRQQISEKYLEQVFSVLRKKNLLKSEKGAAGGYRLAKKPSEISAYDVISSFGKEMHVVPTNYRVNLEDINELSQDKFIEKKLWERINLSLIKKTKEITLEALLKDRR